MKIKVIAFIILFGCLVGCYDEFQIKPMKYNRHGENLSCDGYYRNNKLQKVLCFSKNRDTILSEYYIDGVREGSSLLSYSDGNVKEKGNFLSGKQEGVWKEFYQDETLKSYRFFEIMNDSSFLIYEKLYTQTNDLYSLRFPLKFRTNSDSIYQVGETYQLFVELQYSEFDTVHSYGFIEPSLKSSVNADTISYEGKSIYLEFTPQVEGELEISGTYVEVDGSKLNAEDGYGGEKKWTFKYKAIR